MSRPPSPPSPPSPRAPGCARHHHPALPRPIPQTQLQREAAQLWTALRLPQRVRVRLTAALHRAHERDGRRYAQVEVPAPSFPLPNPVVIEFAPQALWLAAENRLALLAHEIGHLFTPGGTEEEADEAAHLALGLHVHYDVRWPGKGLQTLQTPRRSGS